MTYKESTIQAMQSATRLMRDGRAHAVKVEGGQEIADSVRALTAAGIPVMGHIGLTPQSVHALGGFKVQGRKQEAAALLRQDAIALEEAGCFSLVLEGIPASLAAQITRSLNIPTMGIGAGPHCDGQVLVCYDLLGLNPHFKPKFLKQYARLHENVSEAVKNYCDEVRAGIFPASEHSFDEPWTAINDDDLPEGIRYAGSH
jgi:3-methyl-2-oxobutanoate hydroxymethyltransferase